MAKLVSKPAALRRRRRQRRWACNSRRDRCSISGWVTARSRTPLWRASSQYGSTGPPEHRLCSLCRVVVRSRALRAARKRPGAGCIPAVTAAACRVHMSCDTIMARAVLASVAVVSISGLLIIVFVGSAALWEGRAAVTPARPDQPQHQICMCVHTLLVSSGCYQSSQSATLYIWPIKYWSVVC